MKMKKIILAIFTLSIIGVSCSKKQELITTTTTTKKTRTVKPTATQHYESSIKECITPASNCTSPVVVKHPKKEALVLLNYAIKEGTKSVTSFFNSEEGISLNEYFGDAYISLLQNGDYTVISDENTDTGTTFYLLGNASNLNLENAEFVLPTTN